MPIRRLNYTDRKRIRQNDVRVTVRERDNGSATFDADLKLDHYELPGNALVFVEAQRQTSYMRFSFGTVASLQPTDNRKLSEFDSSEGVLFRVKITSTDAPKKGLLLAEADRIRPRRLDREGENRIPLLPAKPDRDLGDQVFRVDFTDRPILLINARVGDWRAVARHPVFVSLVCAGAMREILTRILHIERHFDTDDTEDWRSRWLRFAESLPGVPELPPDCDEDRLNDWLEEAVASFCRKFRMMGRFTEYWTTEGPS